jgi:hypothetical protein
MNKDMEPDKKLLQTATLYILDYKLKFKRSHEPGEEPYDYEIPPYNIVINTADERLWITDGEGNPVEYKLVKV